MKRWIEMKFQERAPWGKKLIIFFLISLSLIIPTGVFASSNSYLPSLGDLFRSLYQYESNQWYTSNEADLRISSINYDRDDERLEVRIQNEGSDDITNSFRVKVRLNSKSYYFNVNRDIDADSSYLASFSVNNFYISSSRRYEVEAIVDVNNNISESNEWNNTYSKEIYLYENEDEYEEETDDENYRPDLKVTDLEYSSSLDRLWVEIANRWDGDVREDFRIRVKIDDRYYYFLVEKTIEEGDEIWYYIDMDSFSIERTGTFTVYIKLDTDSDIRESSELNNTYEKDFYLYKNEESNDDLPDLKVTDIKYDRSDQELGVRIYNKWDERVDDEFRLRVEINQDKEYIDVTKSIWDNGYYRVYIEMDNFDIKKDDNYVIKVDVDIDGDIKEWNEGNNSYEERIYLYESGEADLKVSDIVYDVSNDELEIRIYNDGEEDVTDDFQVRIEIDGRYYYVDMIEKIDNNTYKRLKVDYDEFNIKESKYYTIRVLVDYDEDVEEKSESNNSYSESIYLNKN